MSYDDFCRCTPEEFGEVCRAWHDQHEAQIRDAWERARWQANIIIMPHVKGKPKLPLPWDKELEARRKSSGHSDHDNGIEAPTLTKAEQMRRMAEVARRVGGADAPICAAHNQE